MNAPVAASEPGQGALQICMRLNFAQARLRRKLDDELGTQHGLSLSDFVLIDALSHSAGLSAAALEAPLGVQRSAVLRQVVALEKTGWVQRFTDDQGQRLIALRAPGRRLHREARETLSFICKAALFREGSSAGVHDCIETLCNSAVLAVP